jgi:hypothetical protein
VNNIDPSGHAIAAPDAGTRSKTNTTNKKTEETKKYTNASLGALGKNMGAKFTNGPAPTSFGGENQAYSNYTPSGGAGSVLNDALALARDASAKVQKGNIERIGAAGVSTATVLGDKLQITLKNALAVNRQFCSGNLGKTAGKGISAPLFQNYNSIWKLKNDAQGLEILFHWIWGDGSDFIRHNGAWGEYMKANPILTSEVKEIVLPLAEKVKINEKVMVNITTAMVIENGEDIIGYQYLHGTNADAGGFTIVGTVSKNNDGDTTYDITYTWNDIIDPNLIYDSDKSKVGFAQSLPFAQCRDYIIKISWTDTTIIKNNPHWFFNWNSGWLS